MDLLLLVLAFIFGWWLHKITTLNRILRDPDHFIDLLTKYKAVMNEDDQSNPEEVEIERINDTLYVYTKNSKEFLAQAPTLEEALSRINKRFPNRTFKGLISKEQAEALGISAK